MIFRLLFICSLICLPPFVMAAGDKEANTGLQELLKLQSRCEWEKALEVLARLEARGGKAEFLEKLALERQAIQSRMAFETTVEGKRWREFNLLVIAAHDQQAAGVDLQAIDSAYKASQMYPGEWPPYAVMAQSFVKLGRWEEALSTLDSAEVLVEDKKVSAGIPAVRASLVAERDFAAAMTTALTAVKEKKYKDAAAAFESAWNLSGAVRLPAAAGAVACHLVLNERDAAKTLTAAVDKAGKAVQATDAEWSQWKALKSSATSTAQASSSGSSGGKSKGKSTGKSATPRKKSMAEQFLDGL